MAKYTTQIRSIVEAGHPIFDFEYPIFDEKYRSVLETKIINHYYFREIGLETVGQFKWFLKAKMNEIMPYYNQLYESTLIEFDPLNNLNTTETFERKLNSEQLNDSSGNVTNNSEQGSTSHTVTAGSDSGTSKSIENDTPSSKLGDQDYASRIVDQLDEGTQNSDTNIETESKGQESSTSINKHKAEVNNFEDYVKVQKGSGGMRYPADIIIEWRKSFINIDVQIIGDLKDLFMNIY